MPTVEINQATLYYEIRGTGPPVLLIMGATGDGGHFDALADQLADEFTVVSYDRRGNGRSRVPAGWRTTSPAEQADDAAALLTALGTGPAAVFGTSSGANFALCLMIRHPELVRGAILHEPALAAVLDHADAAPAQARTSIQRAMESGGPSAAVEQWWRHLAGDHGWDRLTPALRERLRTTASTMFGIEAGTYEHYLPDPETLAEITVPVRVLVSDDGLPVFAEIASRVAERLGSSQPVPVVTVPGTHVTYHEHPQELAEAIRPFLRHPGPSDNPSDDPSTDAEQADSP